MQALLEKNADGLNFDRSNWKLVKFGDVAIQQKKIVDRENTNLTRYVKGEHMFSEDLSLRKWGELKDEYLGPAFIRKFDEGDILYGSRRTYLRKVAVAPFDGITSNTTFVIKANGQLIDQRLLPFVMLSESFSQHSIRNSKGSVNPYVNWKDLSSYEFLLPTSRDQNDILDLFMSSLSVIEQLRKLQNTLEHSLISHRNSLFYDQKWDRVKLKDYFDVQLGKMLSSKSKTGKNPFKYLTNQNVQWGYIDTRNLNEMDFNDKEQKKFNLTYGDLLVCEGGEVGRTAIWKEEVSDCYYQKALHRLRSINGNYLPEIMLQFMQWAQYMGVFKALTGHSTIAHLTAVELKELKIPKISYDVQIVWKKKFEEIDKVREKIAKQLDHTKALHFTIVNQVF